MTNKKVAFFFFETRDINTYPSITNAIRILTEHSYLVEMYLPSAMQTDAEFSGAKFIISSDQNPFNYISNTVKHIRDKNIDYDFLFAFSIEALIVLYKLNRKRNEKIPSAYFSMELIYNNYVYNLFVKFLKGISIQNFLPHFIDLRARIRYLLVFSLYNLLLQQSGGKFIKFSIIQDVNRGKLLKKEFKFVDEIVYVPNSYIGFSDKKSDYAYKKFSIHRDKKIILFTGGLGRGFDRNLIKISKKLSSEYVLFINTYSSGDYLNETIESYKEEIEKGALIFNQKILNESDYDQLVKSTHICLAWYPKVSQKVLNMYYLGYSSGKTTKYLSCGKPVIAQDFFYGYKELIEGNQLGLTCDTVHTIPDKIEEIEKNYPFIQEKIKEFYLENLEYKKKFEPVLSMLGRFC